MASIIGDKIKLSNFGYVIEPKNYSTGNKVTNDFITNDDYVITYSGSRRYWDKTVDAFDIDWRPYGMEVEDWNNENNTWERTLINFENVEDIFNVMRHGLTYAVLAKEAQNVAGFWTTGEEVYSEYTSLSNIKILDDNSIAYTYTERPFIFATKNDIAKSNVVNGNTNTIGTSANLSYSLVFGTNNKITSTGKTNLVFGESHTITGGSANLVIGSTITASASTYSINVGVNNNVTKLGKSLLIGSNNTVSTLSYSSVVLGNENNLTTGAYSFIAANKNTLDKVENSVLITGEIEETLSSTYSLVIANNTVTNNLGTTPITNSVVVTNSTATFGGANLKNSIVVGEQITTNNVSDSLMLGKNLSGINNDGAIIGGVNISVSNSNGTVALGNNLMTGSENESALGTYNVSNSAYLLSIGNGASTERHNVLTIFKNGTIAAENIRIDNFENIIFDTWNNINALSVQNKLQPGRLYCIYDYQTLVNETTQIKSNKNVYPLVLLAISQSAFSTNGWLFVGNHPYFGAKLFVNENDFYVNVGVEKTGESFKWKWVKRVNGAWTGNIIYTDKPNYPAVSENNKLTLGGVEFVNFKNYDGGIDTGMFDSTYPWRGEKIVEIKYDIRTNLGRQYSNTFITANTSNNKGFIYWMKDMNDNEADFDLYSITWTFANPALDINVNGLLTINNSVKHNKIFNSSNIILIGDNNTVNNSSNIVSTGNKNTFNNSSNVYCSGSHTTLNYSNNNKITIGYCDLEDSHNITIEISGVIPTIKIKMYSCNNVIINKTDYTLVEPILFYNIENKTVQLPNVNGPLIYRSSLTREILL